MVALKTFPSSFYPSPWPSQYLYSNPSLICMLNLFLELTSSFRAFVYALAFKSLSPLAHGNPALELLERHGFLETLFPLFKFGLLMLFCSCLVQLTCMSLIFCFLWLDLSYEKLSSSCPPPPAQRIIFIGQCKPLEYVWTVSINMCIPSKISLVVLCVDASNWPIYIFFARNLTPFFHPRFLMIYPRCWN